MHELVARLRSARWAWLMLHDAMALYAAYVVFSLIRYEGGLPPPIALAVVVLAFGAVMFQLLVGSALRIYQGRVVVAGLEETILISVVVVTGALTLGAVNLLASPPLISRSVPLGAGFMALAAMLLSRSIWRRYNERMSFRPSDSADPTLVFGAGSAGRQLVRSMLETPTAHMRPVGILDDDPWKRRLRVDGVPVLGSRRDIAEVAARTRASRLVIAIPSAGGALIREVSSAARAAGLEVKVLPGVGEILTSRVTVRDVRDIDVHDLLGRAAIETDIPSIAGYLTGRRVLVTGAGGSIGAELCRQISKFGPAELIMLDRDESALHAVQLSLEGRALLDSGNVVLADIRDRSALRRIFSERRPEVVFHAAALKHLPMLQQYPIEAMKTNVAGTVNVLKESANAGVERFVNISTDKAADPSSVLGYSKRVAERLTAAVAADTSGTYLSVRFGNVLGSRGSVLTSFAAQIAAGGPVTVTHPDVTRYFMTIEEAVQLVIQAAAIGSDGEALVLDMGEPVMIEDVARQLIEESGKGIEIVYTGLREGEKLHEHLLGSDEAGERRVHPLVTHVAVPELPVSSVTAEPLDVHPDVIHKRLAEWCHVDGGRFDEVLEIGPREWSSIER